MRDDAARALRVDDELPRPQVELRSVDSIDDDYADLRARASERRFERTPRTASTAAVALQEPAPEPPRETVRVPRTAPGRSYGAHRREDPYTPSYRVAGPQPGRRTIEITGQVQAPRRRSQTSAAFAARPDRAALWAFLLALFMVLMAGATAHAGA